MLKIMFKNSAVKKGNIVDLRAKEDKPAVLTGISASFGQPALKTFSNTGVGRVGALGAKSVLRSASVAPRPVQKSGARNFSGGRGAFSARSRKSSGLLVFLSILLVLLIAAAVAGFFVFNAGGGKDSLKISLKGPKEHVAGQELTLEIAYENLDKVPLEKMQLVAEYPEGFYFTSSSEEPANPEHTVWRLKDLAAGQSNKISLTGTLYGEKDSNPSFNFIINYQPVNFNSNFKSNLAKEVKIIDVLYPLELEAPEKINNGDEAELKLVFKNNSDSEIKDVFLGFELGQGFYLSGITPSTTDYLWPLASLQPKAEAAFSLKGKIDPDVANPMPWRFRLWQEVMVNSIKEQRYFYQRNGSIEVVRPEAKIDLVMVTEPSAVSWGKNIQFKITYQNIGKIDLEKPVISLALGDLIDWGAYQPPDNIRVENKTVYWLPNGKNDFLQAVKPEATGNLEVSLPIIGEPADALSLSPEELMLKAKAKIALKFNNQEVNFESGELTVPLKAEAGLTAEARYYLDAKTAVGQGPLPPVVGKETTYRIYWKAFSGSSALTNVKVKATLPVYINWRGQSDKPTFGADLVFDEAKREVSWQISDLPAYSQAIVSFNVMVNPDASQVNQLLILANPTLLTASEKDSGGNLSKTSNLLTSDLPSDPAAQGKGRVQVK